MMRRVAFALLLAAACGGEPPAPGAGAPGAAAPVDTLHPVAGTRLFVHREGTGEPMVFVHGGPLLDHGYLVEPFRPLADRYDLVFADQRLSGRSDPVVDSASVRLDVFAADIEGIRTALALGRIHLVGHSWGGLLAMRYATLHPDALRTLILLDPMPPTAALWQAAEAELAASLEPADTAGMGALRASPAFAAGDPAAIEDLLKRSFRSQFADPENAARLAFRIGADYGTRSRQFSYIGEDLVGYDLREALKGVEVPTLIVYGDAEIGVGPGIAALADALPDATVATVASAGHFPFVERPAETRRILDAWLAGR